MSAAHNDPKQWIFEGKQYGVLRASDVADRDGYGWELHEGAACEGRFLMEAFYDDTTRRYTFSSAALMDLPLALVQQFLEEAAEEIGPSAE